MRRFLILNLVLSATLFVAAVRFHNEWFMFEAAHQTGAIQPQPETVPRLVPASIESPSVQIDWTDIPSRNPFSFDRTDIAIDIAILEPAAPPKPAGPKPVLFGTITLGKDRLAMVAQGQPGNRSYKPMKVGEVIDGWTITEILDKSITITANTLQDSVIMNDPSAQVPRDYTRTLVTPAPSVSPAAAPVSFPPPSTSQPGTGQRQTRRVLQQTPFGVREIEEPVQ